MGVHNNRNALQIPEKINRNDPNNDRNALQKSGKINRSDAIIRNSRVEFDLETILLFAYFYGILLSTS